MDDLRLGDMEEKFADMIWQKAPVPSGELVKLCESEFGWKKSTTYTMLRRLCERGIFANSGGTVETLINKEDFLLMQGQRFLDDNFGGSVPKFLAAFTDRKKLSQKEINEIKKLIEETEE